MCDENRIIEGGGQMKILVTGASGNVGTYVVQELLNMGEEVVAAGTDKLKLQKIFGNKT